MPDLRDVFVAEDRAGGTVSLVLAAGTPTRFEDLAGGVRVGYGSDGQVLRVTVQDAVYTGTAARARRRPREGRFEPWIHGAPWT